MAVLRQNVRVYRGDDRAPVIATTVPFNAAMRAEVRPYPDGPVLQRWATTDGSAAVEDGATVLLCDDSDTWSWRTGEYRLWRDYPDGSQTLEALGSFRVSS